MQRDEAYRALRRSQQELMEMNLELQRLTNVDGLTGLGNRRYFDEFLDTEWRQALRAGEPISLLMIDIDFFKQFNDSHGHVLGDACLVEVATALAEALPAQTATVARYGGEEFAVVLPGTTADAAHAIARRLLAAIEQRQIPHPSSPLGVVTVSIGITTCPATAYAAINLLQQADAALYRAKRNGRNCCAHAQDAAQEMQGVATPG
jgi:diguanylate cyclase (GGDEF)-like protein